MKIVLTGTTGNVGYYILNRLVKNNNIKCIYVPIRIKKNKSVHERFDDLFNKI